MSQTAQQASGHAAASQVIGGGAYRRLFPHLPPYSSDTAFVLSLGVANGACDGTPFCDTGEDISNIPAGWPYFAQFIAHDITADRSPLKTEAEVTSLRNVRTPTANLECIYGDGPAGHPYLYQRKNAGRFLLSPDPETGHDVPRNGEGVALVADPRNDSQFLINQFHVAMLKAHNRLMEECDGFEEAQCELRWTYQWLIINEFLPVLVGEALMADLLENGCRYFHSEPDPYIPIEFADAAYRYGHSQICHAYRLNAQTDALPVFPDLLGFQPVPKEYAVDWTYFFDTPQGPAKQRSKQMDGRLPHSLIHLPEAVTGEVDDPAFHSLAARDLQRGQMLRLPSSETLAAHLGETPLTNDQLGLTAYGWQGETPLWYYILREAKFLNNGDRLGPVGGRLVAEVLLGIIDSEPASYRAQQSDWQPRPGRQSLGELLTGYRV